MGTWKNANSVAVGGDGEVYTASSGTTVPQTVAEPAAAFVGHGLLSEDGVSIAATPNVQELNVWQLVDPVRRTLLSRSIVVSFAMAQWDENSVPLAFGGGTVTGSSPYVYAFPATGAGLEERALIVDAVDGTEHHRFAFKRVNVTEPVETTWNRSSLATLSVGASVLAPADATTPGYYVTDATSFAAGS